MKYYFSQDHYVLFYTQGGPCWQPMKIRLPLLLKPWLADVFPRRQPRRGHHGRGWPSPPHRRTGRGTSDRGQAAETSSPAPGAACGHGHRPGPHTQGPAVPWRPQSPGSGGTGISAERPCSREGPRTFSLGHQNCWVSLLQPLSLIPIQPCRRHSRVGRSSGATPRTDHRASSPAAPSRAEAWTSWGDSSTSTPLACKMELVGVPTSSGSREDWGSLCKTPQWPHKGMLHFYIFPKGLIFFYSYISGIWFGKILTHLFTLKISHEQGES